MTAANSKQATEVQPTDHVFVPPTEMHVICRRCAGPVHVRHITTTVNFPRDEDALVALLRGTLNSAECPTCQQVARVVTPVFVSFRDPERIAVLLEPASADHETAVTLLRSQLVASLAESGASPEQAAARARVCDNYDEWRLSVVQWVLEESQTFFLLVLTGDIVNVSRDERTEAVSRLSLRLLRLVADGVVLVQAGLPPHMVDRIKASFGVNDANEALRLHWKRQVAGTVYQVLRDELANSATPDSLSILPETLAARVPPDAIDDTVLEACRTDCRTPEESSTSTDVAAAYLDEYLNAAAHALTAKPNPRRAEWTALVGWTWDTVKGTSGANSWLPAARLAASVLRFEDVWDWCINRYDFKSAASVGQATEETIAFMTRLGFKERVYATLRSGVSRVLLSPHQDPLEVGGQLARGFLSKLQEKPLGDSPEHSMEFGVVAGGLLQHLVVNGFHAGAAWLAAAIVEHTLREGDYVAAFAFGVEAIRELTRADLVGEAVDVIEPLMSIFTSSKVVEQLGNGPPKLPVDFWIECGNAMRSARNHDGALGAYTVARGLLPGLAGHQLEHVESVIAGNEARVFRDIGKYQEAHERLRKMVERNPNDVQALHSLCLLCLTVNLLPAAKDLADRGVALCDGVTDARQLARVLQARGMCRARLGDAAFALADFGRALQVAPPEATALRFQISAAIAIEVAAVHDHPVVLEAKQQLLYALDNKSADVARASVEATAIVALGELAFASGSRDALAQLLSERVTHFLDRHPADGWPWELLALRARLAVALEPQETWWPWFSGALDALEQQQPMGEDGMYAAGWLTSKDRFQLRLADAVIELVGSGQIPRQQLLPVYEFCNSRSISSSVSDESIYEIAKRVGPDLEELATTSGADVTVIGFLEGTEIIQMFAVKSGEDEPRLVPDVTLRVAEARRLRAAFVEALSYANPEDVATLDACFATWADLAVLLGASFANCIGATDQVAILASRSLVGMPLHLCPMGTDGTPMILDHAVTYGVNLAMLLRRNVQRAEAGEPLLLSVGVGKELDADAFRDALEGAAKTIAAKAAAAELLIGTDATQDRIQVALARANEAYFLCHGAYGGKLSGFALCISDGLTRSPSLLSIDDVPELKRFTLDWRDMSTLERTPALFVSIACSSGRSLMVDGGSRLGLEQAAFALGTTAMVAPQWDVDQAPALTWVLELSELRRRPTTAPIAASCRIAALATRRHFEHPFFWGAFALTGSLFA